MTLMSRLGGFRAAACAGVLVASAALALPGDKVAMCCFTKVCSDGQGGFDIATDCISACSSGEDCTGTGSCSPYVTAAAKCKQKQQ